MPLSGIGIIFLIGALAETNRTPFDLSEAESELVSGFATEYSSLAFAFFFLSEYCSVIGISAIMSIIFLGGYRIGEIKSSLLLGLKVAVILFIMI